MTKITITIDGDNVTVNQSVAPTKVENTTKRYFIVIGCDDDYIYKLYMQDEKGNILPCNGTDWDIDR